jgi:hypothetical protein
MTDEAKSEPKVDENLRTAEDFSLAFNIAQEAFQVFEARAFELRTFCEDDANRAKALELLSAAQDRMLALMKNCNLEIAAAQTRYGASQNVTSER